MKKGQLLSQPFFYIFAIVVIGLLLIFGFKYAGKILNTSCQVETLDFVSDVQAKVNELYSLSYGSSFECSIVRASGQTENKCELVLPDNVKGICFVDTKKSYDKNKIIFADLKELIPLLGSNANRNLFFSTMQGASCKSDHALIKKLTTEGVVCLDTKNKNPSFIMENSGNFIIVKNS